MLLLPLLATLAHAGEVEALFADADQWMPRDHSAAMERVEALGPAAVPSLVSLVGQTDDRHRLFSLCSALERLADPRALPALRETLGHEQWLVRSSCGSAFAASVPQGDAESAGVAFALVRGDRECSVRRNVAAALAHPTEATCNSYASWLDGREACGRVVAIHGLPACPGEVRPRLVQLALQDGEATQVREAALYALARLEPWDPGLEAYRALATGDPPGNVRAAAIDLLGGVGTREDLDLLRAIQAERPGTVWSSKARDAARAIEARSR